MKNLILQLNKICILILLIISLFSCATSNNLQTSNVAPPKAVPAKAYLPTSQSECLEGRVRQGYLQPIVNSIETCTPSTQTCLNGQWTGPMLYITCDNPTEPCGGTPHGTMENGFSGPTAPCLNSSRTCIDGNWVGPQLFNSCN